MVKGMQIANAIRFMHSLFLKCIINIPGSTIVCDLPGNGGFLFRILN